MRYAIYTRAQPASPRQTLRPYSIDLSLLSCSFRRCSGHRKQNRQQSHAAIAAPIALPTVTQISTRLWVKILRMTCQATQRTLNIARGGCDLGAIRGALVRSDRDLGAISGDLVPGVVLLLDRLDDIRHLSP